MKSPLADHPKLNDLRAFGLGKLDPVNTGTIARHLETCAECRQVVSESAADSFLNRLRDAQPEQSPELAGPPGITPEGKESPALQAITELPGTVIGPYKLLQQIGEGGMGTVFLAEQTEPVQRKVALKLIKSGMDSRQVLARFEAERQALALMDHPNIARVLDAGSTTAGRPYFVMELVKGVPITRYCNDNHLTPRERLELIVPVCQAVQHAHQKGIIHRDLKPSNVLVAMYDDKPVPKVIDFGVAKAASPKLTERTMFTEIGQVIGTLEYMSPEQASFNNLDIDTRSDIYSLGVLLYELLTGSTPFEKERLREAAYDEMLRIIREEDPPKPSTRLSSSAALPSIAAHRNMEPAKLSRLVKGDLDWIVMKALEKNRSRRYETANGMAHDLENYLHDEPVLARPPSLRYRLSKVWRRNRGPVAAGLALLALLVLGIVSTSIALAWALQAEREATEAATGEAEQRAAAVTDRDRARIAETQANEARDNELRQLYAADMFLASTAVIQGPLSRAVELLDAWFPERRGGKEYRGREWHMLRRLCYTSEKTLIGHEGPLRALAWTRDGKRLASAGADRIIRVWDAETGNCLQTLVGHSAGVFDVAFSPDGKMLASASADSTVRMWEIDSGKELHVLRGHILPVYSVAFHPDGKQLATAGGDTIIKVWDTANGTELFVLQGHEAAVGRLQFDAAGKKLASCGITRGTLVWDIETRKVVDRVQQNGDLVFTPEFATCIVAPQVGNFGIIDVKTKKGDSPDLGMKGVHAVDMNATARIAAISGADDTIRVIDRVTTSTLATHRGHVGPARRVLLRFDSRKLASAGDDRTVQIWNVPDPNEPIAYSRHHQHLVTGTAFSQDGTLLASGDYLGSIAIWDTQTGKRSLKLGSHYLRRKSQTVPLEIGTGKPFEEGKILKKSTAHFTPGATAVNPILECITSVGHAGEVKGVAFTPDKKILVSAGAQDLIIWDVKERKPIKEFEHPTLVSSVAVSADGTLAATGCWDDIVRIFHVPSGELVKQLEGHGDDVMSVAFHPNGKELATGSRDRAVFIWDVETGKIKHRLRRHVNAVSVVRYTPDGTRLVSGGMDKAIYLWNSETGAYESTLHGHNDGVTSLAFSADGKWLVSASDGTDDIYARVWLWNGGRFREGALIDSLGSKGPTTLAVHPLTGDLLMGRSQLKTFETKPTVERFTSTAEPVAPEVLRANAPTDGRLKVLGYALVEVLQPWGNSKKGRLKLSLPDSKFLVIATSLPFGRLKTDDVDYRRLLEVKKKEPEANEPLKFSSMLIYPERFALAGGEGKTIPAQFVGRMATSSEEGFEFMKSGKSMLENMTVTPQLDTREHVYLAWEVAKDFSTKNLLLRFQNDEFVAVPSLELETFRPGKPFHTGSRSFDAGEGANRLRSNISRSPGP